MKLEQDTSVSRKFRKTSPRHTHLEASWLLVSSQRFRLWDKYHTDVEPHHVRTTEFGAKRINN